MRFYQFSALAHPRYLWAEPEPMPADVRTLYLRKTAPKPPPQFSVVCGRERGHALGSFLWDRAIVEALETAQAAGFGSYPARVKWGRTGIRDVFGIHLFGAGGQFDTRASGAKWSESGVWYHRAVYMDTSKWDGSDVFTIRELGMSVFLSERAAAPLLKMKLRNCQLTLNSECRFML